MIVRYESIRGELGFPSLQELGQNCFGIPEKGAEWACEGVDHGRQRLAPRFQRLNIGLRFGEQGDPGGNRKSPIE